MKKAIVLIEFQNEWLSPEGSLYPLIETKLQEKKTISHTVELLEKARENECAIIHAPLIFNNHYIEINDHSEGLFKAVKANKRFDGHTTNSDIYKAVTPQKTDIIASGRVGTSAFSGSNLDHILRGAGIEELYFAGFITEVCVLSTLIDAYNKGYQCRLLSDCTLSPDENAQQYTEHIVDKHFGKVVNNAEFLNV